MEVTPIEYLRAILEELKQINLNTSSLETLKRNAIKEVQDSLDKNIELIKKLK